MKLSVDAAERPDGYKVLDYIYEHGADTVDEIGVSTGLSREQVVSHLQVYLNHGLVEELEPGTRVVSYVSTFCGWTPVRSDVENRIYLYEAGKFLGDIEKLR